MLRLRLLGGISILSPRGAVTADITQPRGLAELALLAATPTRTMSRDKVAALLWPERDRRTARHRLADTVHEIRKALGPDVIRNAGDELALDSASVTSDVGEFDAALAVADPERAVGLYLGPFLDGFFVKNAPDFERWVDSERQRLAMRAAKAIEELAVVAERRDDAPGAVKWWREAVHHDPYNSQRVLRLMDALVSSGDRAGALPEARSYARLMRDDLELEPDPEVLSRLERLRARQPTEATHQSFIQRDPEAHAAFLQGRYFLNKRTRDGMLKAVHNFQRALGRQPGFARAHAGLAEAYLMLGSGNHGVLTPNAAITEARHNAECAIALDEALTDAHVALGIASMHEWQWRNAVQHFRRAIELDPDNPAALHRFVGCSRGPASRTRPWPWSIAHNSWILFLFRFGTRSAESTSSLVRSTLQSAITKSRWNSIRTVPTRTAGEAPLT